MAQHQQGLWFITEIVMYCICRVMMLHHRILCHLTAGQIGGLDS